MPKSETSAFHKHIQISKPYKFVHYFDESCMQILPQSGRKRFAMQVASGTSFASDKSVTNPICNLQPNPSSPTTNPNPTHD